MAKISGKTNVPPLLVGFPLTYFFNNKSVSSAILALSLAISSCCLFTTSANALTPDGSTCPLGLIRRTLLGAPKAFCTGFSSLNRETSFSPNISTSLLY